MPEWDAYSDLMPDAIDLGQNWKKMADEPPALLVPFEYRADRQPDRLRFVFADGQVREAVEALKDGRRAPFNIGLWTRRGFRANTAPPEFRRAIRDAVIDFVREMEVRTHMRLCLTHESREDFRRHPVKREPIVVDDFDGLQYPPMVRFALAPRESRSPSQATPADDEALIAFDPGEATAPG